MVKGWKWLKSGFAKIVWSTLFYWRGFVLNCFSRGITGVLCVRCLQFIGFSWTNIVLTFGQHLYTSGSSAPQVPQFHWEGDPLIGARPKFKYLFYVCAPLVHINQIFMLVDCQIARLWAQPILDLPNIGLSEIREGFKTIFASVLSSSIGLNYINIAKRPIEWEGGLVYWKTQCTLPD